jgi:hypothetical protein
LPLPDLYPPRELTDDLGCFVWMAIFTAFGVIVAFATGLMWLIVPIVAIALVLALVIAKLKIGIQGGIRELEESDQVGLLVYSDSPLWKSHIEHEWLPRFGGRIAVLNWSERRTWDRRHPLVQLYQGCANPDDETFTPLLVMLRKERRPLIFTFYGAFKHAKFGKPEALEGLERQMFGLLLYAQS